MPEFTYNALYRGPSMKRRQFLGLIGSTLASWPLIARAQQPPMPVIGFLNSQTPGPFAHLVAAFRRGLGELGFTEGQNVTIEYRWAEGQYERLSAQAAELVQRQVAVLVVTGGETASLAAKAATSTIPIVFALGGDPVTGGFVGSLNRPEGNMTGLTQFSEPLEGKRLGLLHEWFPNAVVAVLTNPTFPPAERQLKDLAEAGSRLGVRLIVVAARAENEFEPAFNRFAEKGAGALLVSSDPFFNSRRYRLIELAAIRKLPAIYEFREFTEAGGLVSYGASLAEGYRQVGRYAAQILKGAKPADLPVLQPTKFEMIINLKTAKSLGLEVPPTLLARADDVIE
ncbi:MAG TPA: ABC transporter substrate-binding protein [Bradyrhizobium sp.]|nr:ABC transporter substrate-binding protein [Bradyrhizobium sp.]